MKIKVVFDSTNSTKILNLLKQCDEHELEIFDFKYSNEKKKGYRLLSKYGAITLPFLVFEKILDSKEVEFNPIWIGDTKRYPTIEQINKVINGKN